MAPRLAMLLATSLCIILASSVSSAALVCLRGSFLTGSYCSLCPGGTFGGRPGLTSPQCSGECLPGHFCPPGSVSATEKLCGSTTYYCPRGSAERQRVDQGFYTVAFPLSGESPTVVGTADQQTACEPGFYCVNGIRRQCPAGTYGLTAKLITAACTGPCTLGFYCPEGTSNPLPCPAGAFGADSGLKTMACSGQCPVGYYCEAATVMPQPCPAGTFGGVQGLKTKDCSAQCSGMTCLPSPCPAGFFCPLATTSPTVCGDASVFCPEGSAAPTVVSTGYYSIRDLTNNRDAYLDGGRLATENQTTRSDQHICEQGTYCVRGIKRPCPSGTYGNAEGLSTPLCSGPCPPGFYCPAGTADFNHFPCASRTSFCRQGSAAPTQVATGYFTVIASTGDVRVDQTVCPPGTYCLDGNSYQCPAGTYGAISGLASATCSGRCQDGYVCAAGSTSAKQSPCPAGQYSRNGVSCSSCLPGYWCTAGSPDPMQNACGSDTAFCPLGSSAPTVVAAGSYAVGQTLSTHTSQAVCLVQTVQHVPQCPSRTVGINSGV